MNRFTDIKDLVVGQKFIISKSMFAQINNVIWEGDLMKKRIIGLALLSALLIGVTVHAKSLENGELVYHGGQTNKIVYSDIRDAKPNNYIKWKVHASVKVGGNTYRSGWKDDEAYVEAARVWYANESSYYDYFRR